MPAKHVSEVRLQSGAWRCKNRVLHAVSMLHAVLVRVISTCAENEGRGIPDHAAAALPPTATTIDNTAAGTAACLLCLYSAAVSEWLSQQQQQQQQQSGLPLLAFRQADQGSGLMTWQLLNCTSLYSSSSSSSSSSSGGSSDASASSAGVLHPLGAQLSFPATLGSLDIEVSGTPSTRMQVITEAVLYLLHNHHCCKHITAIVHVVARLCGHMTAVSSPG
jgi:hypothetical protein